MSVTRSDVQSFRDAFTAASEEMEIQSDLRDWPDEVLETLDAAGELLTRLDAGETLAADDVTVLSISAERAREELETEMDLADWPDELVAAFDSVDELVKKVIADTRPDLDGVEDPATLDLGSLRDDDGYGPEFDD
jgi:hypothetical protein